MTKKSKHREKRVLSDHKQVGKRFIPPFVHGLDKLQEMKWVDALLPELLWLAILNQRHGLERGAELAVAVARAGASEIHSEKKIWFSPISTFTKLDEQQQRSAKNTLADQGCIIDIQHALNGLVALYPECPLAFVFDGDHPRSEQEANLKEMKGLLADLFDKTSRAAMLMQANAIYIAFALDMLRVTNSNPLANFPSVANYPNTEEAKRVGASVRATLMALFGSSHDKSWSWPQYFWNRGIEIDSCIFKKDSDGG